MSVRTDSKAKITLIYITNDLITEGIKRFPCYPDIENPDPDYTLRTAIERRTGKTVKIEFKMDRSPYATYLIIGGEEYMMSHKLDVWRQYLYERQGNVNERRIVLDHEQKKVLILPNKTVNRSERRRRVLEIMNRERPTEQEIENMRKEHNAMVNGGYYKSM